MGYLDISREVLRKWIGREIWGDCTSLLTHLALTQSCVIKNSSPLINLIGDLSIPEEFFLSLGAYNSV